MDVEEEAEAVEAVVGIMQKRITPTTAITRSVKPHGPRTLMHTITSYTEDHPRR
jgi:hypothetical protein